MNQMLAGCEVGPEVGERASYIQPLADADPTKFGLSMVMADGQSYGAGDHQFEFTLQSIAKPFAYALALQECGIEQVLERIGVEPTGEAFNELSLESGSKRPLNPMINAGALVTHSLIGDPDDTADERSSRVLEFMSACAGRELVVNHDVYEEEIGSAHRNLALGHMLKSYDQLDIPAEVAVRGYILQCSANVTTDDLAVMAATLANGGVNPKTGKQVIEREVVHITLSVMLATGMYDDAGDWITHVGIPAKSGVSGGILGVMPGQYGVATYAPPLDRHGNSVRGVNVFQRLSREMGMHLMDAQVMTRSVLRNHEPVKLADGTSAYLYQVQGPLRFASMEQVARLMVDDARTEPTVIFDASLATSLDRTALEMLRQLLARLVSHGKRVYSVRISDDIDLATAASGVIEVDELSEVLAGQDEQPKPETKLLPSREYEYDYEPELEPGQELPT